MANMVPVQGFLTSLYKTQSAEIRQALWSLGYEIDKDDLVDHDEIDDAKVKAQLKKGV
jgi:hypothetical protein